MARGAAPAALLALALCATLPRAAHAQNPTNPAPDAAGPAGLVVDTVIVRGNARLSEAAVRGETGIRKGDVVAGEGIQHLIRHLMDSGNYESVQVAVRGADQGHGALIVSVVERPMISTIEFRGLRTVSGKTVRDTVKLKENAPLDPQKVAAARAMVASLLAKHGVQLVSIDTSLLATPGQPYSRRLVFDVHEGNRLAISQIAFVGNHAFTNEELAAALKTRKEGFWWFRSGRFDRETFDTDLRESLPSFYGAHGYIDFAVVGDTLIVDPATGKARLQVEVAEGAQYRLGEFRIAGNSRFPTDDLTKLFTVQHRSVLGLPFGGTSEREKGEVFDRAALDDATRQVQQMYRNEGYLYAQVEPIVDRVPATAAGEQPTVNVTWAISERSPFYIRRISFVGNSTTHENVIRDRLWIVPGDVYNEDAVLQSYQAINGLGFFETPLPTPDILPIPDSGQVDIVFHVKEKQTGNINFGTVIGGGYNGSSGGFSGFLGYSQPNLFGQGKQANLRVEYGYGRSSFEASYSDPALWGTRNSGSISLFRTGDRYFNADNGRRVRTGGSVQFGAPVPGLLRTRAFLGYTLSRTHLVAADNSCLNSTNVFCENDALASTLSLAVTRDTKNHPLFPTAGTRQSVSVAQTGGPLGGDGNFQKVTSELEWWVPVSKIGSGPHPIRTALGLEAHTGLNFGNVSLFPFERFYVGGTQFGQPLRGYKERTITPFGFNEQCENNFVTSCLGDAFLTVTGQYAFRVNDNLSLQLFGDAGNVWSDVQHVDPTKLFRSAGVGVTIVTPFLGAIGIDTAYGFDKPTPGWEVHFKLGSGF
ncbi:MAG TPA: outer membrane protein assembly factor BamA [Longimicrobiaceae bacterium]|jgi:outer membrane protein insertion porin family|nr:outer membrane protein assembly factor BamA [Longimicrobiaceae bacterium]